MFLLPPLLPAPPIHPPVTSRCWLLRIHHSDLIFRATTGVSRARFSTLADGGSVCVSNQMKHLEIELDLANATENPLFVPKTRAGREPTEAGASLSIATATTTTSDGHTPATNHVRTYLLYVARLLLLLVPPIVGIWGWDNDALVRPHMLSFTYAHITYLVVAHVSTHGGKADKAGKIILGVVVAMYILTCVLVIVLPAIQVTIPSDAGKTAPCACSGCTYLAKTDLPPVLHYKGLFPHGQDGVMAMGGAFADGGKRLSLATVTQLGGLFGLLPNEIQNEFWVDCDGILGAALMGGWFGPCDATCTMKQPSSANCLETMQNLTCQAFMIKQRDRGRSVVALLDRFKAIPMISNPAEDALFKDLAHRQARTIDTTLARFTNGTAFCTTPALFDVDPTPLYNCTVNTAASAGQDSVRWVSHTTLVARIVWSVLAIAHCAVTAVQAPTSTVVDERKPPKYHCMERAQLVLSAAFVAALWGCLYRCLVLLDPGTTVPSLWEHIVGHLVGAQIAMTAILALITCLSLRGRRRQHFDTENTYAVLRWYKAFETMIDVDDGAYYFHYAVLCELLEIVLQVSTLDTMARTNDKEYVLTSMLILSLNLLLTPVAHLSSFYSDTAARRATYLVDTLLESAYTFLNLTTVKRTDLLHFPVLLSLVIPLVTLVAKIHTFVESTTTYIENKARRDSWVAAMFKVRGQQPLAYPRPRKRKPSIALCLCGGTMALSGCVLFAYMHVEVQRVDDECGRLLGTEVWAGAAPRRIFLDGVLERPKCHFSSVVTVEAREKGVTTLTPHIGELVNLTRIALANNDIKSLPTEFATLQRLTEVDLSGNPVWTRVAWQRAGFQTFPPVLFHFLALEELDLSHNDLSTIPERVARFSKLRVVILQNNSIHRHGLPVAMASMPRLERLEFGGNPVARTLSWQGVSPKDLLRCMVFWKDTLEDLDVSHGTWTIDDTRSVLVAAPRLRRLNVSENRLVSVDIDKRLLQGIQMLDVSRNPVASLSWETFVAVDTVWKRGGMVLMSALQVSSLGIEVPRGSPARMVPYAPIEHFLKHSVNLFSVRFTGTGNETFPVCAVPSSVNVVRLQQTSKVNVECVLRWTQLTYLVLQRNELKTIDVSPLTQLTYLGLPRNELKTIDVSPLTQLRFLRLDGNRFNTSVPTAVRNNIHLRCLNLRNNAFFGGMDWLQDMPDLRWLDVRHNTLQGHMPALHSRAPLEFLGLGSSGLVYNESYILSRWPRLENHGDHFRSKDVDFDAIGEPRACIES